MPKRFAPRLARATLTFSFSDEQYDRVRKAGGNILNDDTHRDAIEQAVNQFYSKTWPERPLLEDVSAVTKGIEEQLDELVALLDRVLSENASPSEKYVKFAIDIEFTDANNIPVFEPKRRVLSASSVRKLYI